MDRNGFVLIKGGKENNNRRSDKEFISAHITDTRLMGVLYMYIKWMTGDDNYLHMFFYLDAEETGFEVYRSYIGNDINCIMDIEDEMAGGLGGHMIDIEEKEASALLCEYASFNKEHNLPLPAGKEEYGFMLNAPELSDREKKILLEKECTKIRSKCEIIHYFLMRCFGHDYSMAQMLSDEDIDIRIYDKYEKTSFLKNSISENDEGTYFCESLIESKNQYYIIVSEVDIEGKKISYFKNCSSFAVSTAEAAMILSKSEYINCYEILTDPDTFDNIMKKVLSQAMLTIHENGNLFMLFNPDNSHVTKQVFQMNEDVYGVFYVSKYGQLIVSAHSESEIDELHNRLKTSGVLRFVELSGRYEFKDPVLYDFVNSGFDDFEEFVDYLI